MNKQQKIFWLIIGIILVNIIVGLIDTNIGLIMMIIIFSIIIFGLIGLMLYIFYVALGEFE